jgi:hypothetical protein
MIDPKEFYEAGLTHRRANVHTEPQPSRQETTKVGTVSRWELPGNLIARSKKQ